MSLNGSQDHWIRFCEKPRFALVTGRQQTFREAWVRLVKCQRVFTILATERHEAGRVSLGLLPAIHGTHRTSLI
jgi:hypothetical protein